MGVGTITASLLVPLLADAGIGATWIAVGLVAAVLGAWSWYRVWRHLPRGRAAPAAVEEDAAGPVPWLAIGLIVTAYGLNSAGYVPHSLYWVDYIARELGRGLAVGNGYWLLLGVGGVIGPGLAGLAAGRLGFRRALVIAFAAMTAATALPLVSSAAPALGVSSLVVGAMVPAIITLTAGVVVELSPAVRRQQIWGWATLSFALAQAIAAYGMSWSYTPLGTYLPLFGVAAAALALATLAALAAIRAGGEA